MTKQRKTLWSGRFKKRPSKLFSKFNDSLNVDKRLYKEDIESSIAYARVLRDVKVITSKEAKKITSTLKKIKTQIDKEGDKWFIKNKGEDIHTVIENKLISLIGDTGKKLHTGRSRNDQIATDIRLWLMKELKEIIFLLKVLIFTLTSLAKKNYKTILPGFTHLQHAQPITLGHYFLAYTQKFLRDLERFQNSQKRINVLPLGSGAIGGTSYKINRKKLAQLLKFSQISANSMDAVSDRDFVLEFLFNVALLSVHLSQMAEELILWSTDEFNFIELPDEYSSGSSLMPQKKNPDVPELTRGKCGRLIGNLTSMLTIVKALPLAYNKDLQEDKSLIFDSVDNIKIILKITSEFLKKVRFNKDNMYKASKRGYATATEVADYLVKKGIPFRKAHEITGKIVLHCLKRHKDFEGLNLKEWKRFHNAFENDIIEKIKVESAVNSKNQVGGTAPTKVLQAIGRIKKL